MSTTSEPIDVLSDDTAPAASDSRRTSMRVRFALAFGVGLVVTLLLGVGALYAYDQQYTGRVLPGVRVGTVDLSGLTPQVAASRLLDAYGGLSNGKVVVNGPNGPLVITYQSVGRTLATDQLVGEAMAVGRGGNAIDRAVANARTAIRGVTIAPRMTFDAAALATRINQAAEGQEVSALEASVVVADDHTYSVVDGRTGRTVDAGGAIARITTALSSFDAPAEVDADLVTTPVEPTVSTSDATAAKAAADRMTAPITVAVDGKEVAIATDRLRPLVTFGPTADGGSIAPALDESGLDPILETLAPQVNHPARDAGLKLVGGHVVATGTSREGRTLDAAGMKAALIREIGARQAGMAASPVAAVVTTVAPKLTTADAKAFAPKMKVISSYSVYYWVIINNHWGGNIEGPATVINGTVVPAGAKFDFWKAVGDLRDAPGTGPGNAIEGGKITVTGAFGGGICTTSTTLFNAAFRAGMIPLARQNHNEFIDRYPAGLDATVWIVGKTKQTMSFRNDTEYPILITRTVTGNNSKRWLTFKIWSVPNHRKATVTNTVIQPGERAVHRTVEDPTKPVGYRFFNNAAVDGAKVWTTVTIYDHGKVHWKKRYFSNYPAVDGVTVVGTRT
jgi:vancomycin resistance protein YoaR